MTGEKEAENGALEMCPKSESSSYSVEQDEVCDKDANPSCPMSSKSSPDDATSCSKEGYTGHEQVAEQGVDYPLTTSPCYYVGYDTDSPKWEDHSYIPSQEGLEVACSSVQTEDIIHCMPGYDTNASGNLLSISEQYLGQQPYFSSAGYLPRAVSYQSNSCDFKQNTSDEIAAGPSNYKGQNLQKSKVTDDVQFSRVPLDSTQHLSTSSSNFPGQASKSLSKAHHLNPGIQPVGGANKTHHPVKVSSLTKQEQGGFFPRHSLDRSRPVGQTVNSNDCSKMNEKYNLHKNYEASSELVRGPRANRMKYSFSSPPKNICSSSLIRIEQFNKSDFQIAYKQAKFFMIKSYSEDDIHKSIKYNVWSSTTNGNKKLDAAFRDAEIQMKEKGTKCPIFLFFSVNASGQFVGLAEMMGPVDFKKTMGFWQQDKWSGFFPVTWHIIKDIPNRHFQNITLENNDNRAVTYSRDTQEVGLPQGLRVLHIFKGYPLGTSILDDFGFYESREKSLRATRISRPELKPSEGEYEYSDGSSSMRHLEASFGRVGVSARSSKPSDLKSSLFNHYSNSSLNYRQP